MDKTVQQFAVANLRRRPLVVEVPGFVCGFDPDTTSPYVNYATPLPDAAPTGADVRALVAAFRQRGLLPRLEFAPQAAPAVAPALYAAGFTVEQTHEFLVCTPDTFTAPGGGPVPEAPRSEDDYLAIDGALAEAFSGEFAASAAGAARLRRVQEGGGAVRFVRAPDGGCAGAATCSATAVGTAELAGVGTRPPYRGRGVGAAVTAAVAAAMFDQDASSVWLEYSGDGSRRVYERLGFRPTGTRLYLHLPPA
ncbi:GNAT family N-acetyltransferase [Catellatospora sp. KI3]|uniref:GNAT family N-acetyltransferase n=1 Tax=Catellatospora sp. KI3 TaxID=3041620 RepID=UPI0024822954|nr:GNAT family N-acetyltransferase [Catellatospora sp. KI3]MDI1461607.1 GNAT family N-acetyltransferase [Catellatospora sp. KI3]